MLDAALRERVFELKRGERLVAANSAIVCAREAYHAGTLERAT